MEKLEEIAKELETAGLSLNAVHRLFGQIYAENPDALTLADKRAWNSAVLAYDELNNVREWLERNERII